MGLDAAAFQQQVFVKPRGAANVKRFPGLVLRDGDGDSWRLGSHAKKLPPTLPVWCSDVIQFLSEWRCYVLRGNATSVCYSGDEHSAPVDKERVAAMIAALDNSREGSAAYALAWASCAVATARCRRS